MSMQTLTSAAKNVVGQYDHTGKQLVGAWRAGATRAVSAVNRRFARAVEARSLPLLSADVKSSLIDAQVQLADLVSRGTSLSAEGTGIVLDRVVRRAMARIDRVAETASRIESAFGTTALGSVSKLALPAAYLSLEVANAVGAGADRLYERVSGEAEPQPAALDK